jgi:hypothetical protein
MDTQTFAQELELRVRIDAAQDAVIAELNQYITVMEKRHHTVEDVAVITLHPFRLEKLEQELSTLKALWYDKGPTETN